MTRQVVGFNVLCVFCRQDDLDTVQLLAADYSVQKDNDQAAKCRESGNCSFKSRDYTTAVLHYSQVNIYQRKDRYLKTYINAFQTNVAAFQIIVTDIPKQKILPSCSFLLCFHGRVCALPLQGLSSCLCAMPTARLHCSTCSTTR